MSGTQGLVTFARVFSTKLERLRDGFRAFPSLKHQGQHSLCIERPGLAVQPCNQLSLALKGMY